MTLSDGAYYAFLFANDLKQLHLHVSGENFDTMHSISQELYEEATKEIDDLSEMAIAAGEKVDNFSNVNKYIDDGQWTPIEGDTYNFEQFVSILNEQGNAYIEGLQSIETDEKSFTDVINSMVYFWIKEINFKNGARSVGEQVSDYVDIVDDLNKADTSDDAADMYTGDYEDTVNDLTDGAIPTKDEFELGTYKNPDAVKVSDKPDNKGIQPITNDMVVSSVENPTPEYGANTTPQPFPTIQETVPEDTNNSEVDNDVTRAKEGK
jgi:DNA-binding ferritin-like protein